eukprot:TRINITY_DN1284_c0_g1_i15.p1 TRINITY_DN1284_c0_g1~~TRINITY_DN1284_c0_g1_i15.p1  ORF type:complete len:172 (-),score=23.79 TRINITY_DN1284_c0_g1_i15:93-608(-)
MLVNEFPNKFELVCSHTTRPIRPGEIDRVHYNFVTKEQFQQDIKNHKFVEFNEYNGHFYGTSIDSLTSARDQGKVAVLEIDINGCNSIKKQGIVSRAIFVAPPPPELENLVQRLTGRNTESEEKIRSRIAVAKKELLFKDANPEIFDKILVNDVLSVAYAELKDFFARDIQ